MLYPILYERYGAEGVIHANHNHTGSKLDFYLNYVTGIYLIVIFIISFFLNPYLLYYNMRRKTTLATKLFILLEITDFLTNTYFPIDTIVALFDSEVHPAFYRNVPVYKQILSFVYTVLSYMSCGITSALAYARYQSVVRPFRHARTAHVYSVTVIYACCVSAFFLYSAWGFDPVNSQKYILMFRYCRNSFNANPNPIFDLNAWLLHGIRMLIAIFGIIPGIFFSGLTIKHLIFLPKINTSSDEKGRRSARVIGIMNVLCLLFLLGCILEIIFVFNNTYVTFFSCVITPTTLSSFNPLFYTLTIVKDRRRFKSAEIQMSQALSEHNHVQQQVHAI